MRIEYKIEQNTSIKTYLRQHLGISSRAMTKLKPKGIFLNGEHAYVTKLMKKGDILTLVSENEKEKEYVAENIELKIIYE